MVHLLIKYLYYTRPNLFSEHSWVFGIMYSAPNYAGEEWVCMQTYINSFIFIALKEAWDSSFEYFYKRSSFPSFEEKLSQTNKKTLQCFWKVFYVLGSRIKNGNGGIMKWLKYCVAAGLVCLSSLQHIVSQDQS